MAKFPEPPPVAELRRIGPILTTLPAGTALSRVYFQGGAHPAMWNSLRHWGPGQARFDHHLPDAAGQPQMQDRGILYAAGSGPAGADALAICLAEVFQATRVVNRAAGDPWFAVFETARPLDLLDLRGLWPTRAGASSALCSGAKARARRWSRAIYDAFGRIDGLIYPSSMGGNADAVALYDRAEDALATAPLFNRGLRDALMRRIVVNAAARINYALV